VQEEWTIYTTLNTGIGLAVPVLILVLSIIYALSPD
jgi:hypothetical protein